MSSEQLMEMLVICVQGILTVFAVLIILWVAIIIMHKCAVLGQGKEKKQEKPAAAPAPAAVPKAAPVAAETDDDELIAVLTAAVAASLNTSTYNLRIKSFRRIGQNAPAWNAVSRKEQLENQL